MVWAACVNRENLLNADWLRFLPELNIENLVWAESFIFEILNRWVEESDWQSLEPVLTSASFPMNERTSRLKVFLELKRKTAISLFDIFNIIVDFMLSSHDHIFTM